MDAVPYLFEDQSFLDEPESGKPVIDENDYNFLDHIYTFNLDEVYDMIGQFNDVIKEFEDIDGFDRYNKRQQNTLLFLFQSFIRYTACLDMARLLIVLYVLKYLLFICRVVMVEALSEDLTVEDQMRYYDSCDFAFNFNFIVHLESPLTAEGLLKQTNDWLDNMPEGKTANWVVRT